MAETTFVPPNPYEVLQQSPGPANTRLTLVSGQPVMSSTVNGATTLFVTPYLGALFPVFNPVSGTWRMQSFTETPIPIINTTISQGVTTNANYDVYGYTSSNGLAAFALSPAWSGDTSIGTNPGSAERLANDGMWVNRWDLAGGPGAQRGTYLGTIRTSSSAAIDWQYGTVANAWGPAIHGVYNYFNRKTVQGFISDSTATWVATTNIWRPAGGNSTTARVSAVVGVNEDGFRFYNSFRAQVGASGNIPVVGIGINSITSNSAQLSVSHPTASTAAGGSGGASVFAELQGLPGIGFNFWEAVEAASVGTSATFVGMTGSAITTFSGMSYSLVM